MQEALPTALGQGLATARLTPDDFDERLGWYHIEEIDVLAHAIYPIVRREVGAGHTIDGPFIEECVRAYEGTLERQRGEESGDRPSPEAPRGR
jgi:hypothetical protein